MLFLEYDLEWSFFVFNFQSFFYDDTLRIVILLIYNSFLLEIFVPVVWCLYQSSEIFSQLISLNFACIMFPLPFPLKTPIIHIRDLFTVSLMSLMPHLYFATLLLSVFQFVFFLTCPLIPSSIVSNRIQIILYS